jgi:RNA polymerase sigma-70 factor (ECF subfamily)
VDEAAAIRALYDAGQRAWPGVALPEETFVARVAERDPSIQISELQPDLYLTFACARGDASALAAFDRRFIARVPEYLGHLKRSPAFLDDVAQRLREKLFVAGSIDGYAGRGPLEGWVRVIAMRLALNTIEAEKRHEPSASEPSDDLFGVTSDPELEYIKRRYLGDFKDAFAHAMGTLSAEERNLLRFYLVDRMNIADIGKLFDKSRATIGRWVVECREKLLGETRRALAAKLGAETKDVESLVAVLQSQLDVSIQKFLRE